MRLLWLAILVTALLATVWLLLGGGSLLPAGGSPEHWQNSAHEDQQVFSALSQGREDLLILVRAFLADHRASTGKQVEAVSDDAMSVIVDYSWPGNVRELRNALEYAVVRARGSILQTEDLPPELLERRTDADRGDLGRDEVDQLRAALKRARGNRTRAAALLGISRATLYRRLRELGVGDE